MPTDQKGNRYHKRSRSSSSERDHRNRERRTYDKDKSERFDKYHRRSRSRTPPRPDSQKPKYTLNYQYKSDKRYYESHRDNEKNKYYDSNSNKNYDNSSSKYYDSNSNKREQFEKRDREKPEDYQNRSKYSRYEDSDNFKNRDRQLPYEKKDRGRSSPDRDRKRRRSVSSKSRSNSPKQPNRTESKPISIAKSPPQKFKDPEPTLRNQRPEEPQKEKSHQLLISKPEKQLDAVEQKIFKQFTSISPIKRPSQPQFRQIKQEQPIQKIKANKFQLVLNEARQNLVVSPPPSTFLLLETFRTMNKFQAETLDPKWTNFIKKDMDKYSQLRETTMSKLAEAPQITFEEGKYVFGKQYLWMKDDRNEQELDLRFSLDELKLHNNTLNELMRKMRFLD